MMKLLMVGAGGFVGSVLRYLVSGAAQTLFRNVTFPIGTMVVKATTGAWKVGSTVAGNLLTKALSAYYGV